MKEHRRCCCLILSLLLMFTLILSELPVMTAQAADVQNIANMVIFVRYKSDTRDVFNETQTTSYTLSNWQEIKKMYDTEKNSFSNYISAITEGKLKVTNYFPQEYADGSGVNTFTLSQDSYSTDGQIVAEVLKAIQDGVITVNTADNKLDNRVDGILDNLTVIVQGDTINGDSHAFRSQYGGTETFDGLKVYDFNMMPSDRLVKEDASMNIGGGKQGTIAHEFLHTLGFPDLYRYSGDGDPVGMWDVMSSNFSLLQYPLSYLRAQQGWVTMDTISQSGTYTLTAVSEDGGNKVFALKTPLSDSEFICVEYRLKSTNIDEFEYSIPSSGLLMYRVNTKVDDLTNARGENYIYVYRPGVTDPEAAADTGENGNLVRKAALDVTEGETEYGSTDLSADFTQDTLYYSDGTNSGIRLSDLKLSPDNRQLTFTVSFADYGEDTLWEKIGDNVSDRAVAAPVVYADQNTGKIYTVVMENAGSGYKLSVRSWNGTAWEQVGTDVGQVTNFCSPTLAVCDGVLYLAYVDDSGNPIYLKLDGSGWSQVQAQASDGYTYNLQLLADGNMIYAAYEEEASAGGRKLVIRDLKNGQLITDTLTAQDFCNPAVVKYGDSFYVSYADFKDGKSQVMLYDTMGKTWSKAHDFSCTYTNCHRMVQQGGKIYAFAGASSGGSALAVFDGSKWTETSVSEINGMYDASVDVIGDKTYITYYDTKLKKGRVLRIKGSTIEVYCDNLGTGLSTLNAVGYEDVLYVVSMAQNTSIVAVRKKSVTTPGNTGIPGDAIISTPTPAPTPSPATPTPSPAIPTPPPVQPTSPPASEELVLNLTPPSGYNDNHIHIDGVEYEASRIGSSYTLKLPDNSGRTAVMYCYNENEVPVGMYVWKLSWHGNACTATALPGLQDLLSYHGFSIRTQGSAGIRFKSGINAELKQRLLNDGVDGCRLTEYGTLMITKENKEIYPFVKGGSKVGSGRSYWTENGKTYDKVLETVDGRNRFASVLVDLKPNMYARDLYFRAYAILECDGQTYTVYGPPVCRSVYTVAKQVQAKGEFKPGTGGYNFVQGIIDSVEGR